VEVVVVLLRADVALVGRMVGVETDERILAEEEAEAHTRVDRPAQVTGEEGEDTMAEGDAGGARRIVADVRAFRASNRAVVVVAGAIGMAAAVEVLVAAEACGNPMNHLGESVASHPLPALLPPLQRQLRGAIRLQVVCECCFRGMGSVADAVGCLTELMDVPLLGLEA